MLSVKAVRASGDYVIFQSAHVEVQMADNGYGVDVLLFAVEDEPPSDVITVDNAAENFTALYVMNEHGKTVDSVRAPNLCEAHLAAAAAKPS